MAPSTVCVRLACSALDPPRIPALRLVLLGWLVARASGGRLLVRLAGDCIEAHPALLEALAWLRIDEHEALEIAVADPDDLPGQASQDVQAGVTHLVVDAFPDQVAGYTARYEALGLPAPALLALPPLVDAGGKPLASDDPSLLLETYRTSHLPGALANYLALTAWDSGLQHEVYTLEQIEHLFVPGRIRTDPAVFDAERLRWFNNRHLQRMSPEGLAHYMIPLLRAAYPSAERVSDGWLTKLIRIFQDEMALLTDIIEVTSFYFGYEDVHMSGAALDALRQPPAGPAFDAFVTLFAPLEDLNLELAIANLQRLRDDFHERYAWTGRQTFTPLRAALTGSLEGPPLADIVNLLGLQECLRRVEVARRLAGL